MSYLCQAAVVTCEDFRLHQRRDGRNYMAGFIEALAEECDLITRGGGIHDLVRHKPEFTVSLLHDLAIAVDLHRISVIHLINHQDCGSYAHYRFPTREAELKQHYEDLYRAGALLRDRFPGLEVRLHIAELDIGSSDRYVIKPLE